MLGIDYVTGIYYRLVFVFDGYTLYLGATVSNLELGSRTGWATTPGRRAPGPVRSGS